MAPICGRTFAGALAVVLAALAVREAVREFGLDRGQPARLDDRLADLRAALPLDGVVAYVGRGARPYDVATHRVEAQFVMAPRLLVDDTPHAAAFVVWSDDPARIDALGAERRCRVAARLGRGFAVLWPEGP